MAGGEFGTLGILSWDNLRSHFYDCNLSPEALKGKQIDSDDTTTDDRKRFERLFTKIILSDVRIVLPSDGAKGSSLNFDPVAIRMCSALMISFDFSP